MTRNDVRWRVPNVRRVPPLLPAPTTWTTNALSLLRQPLPMLLVTLAGYAGSTGRDALGVGERELVILRTTWNIGGYFPYVSHVPIARIARRGRSDRHAIQHGPQDPHWNDREAALLDVVDDLQRDLRLDSWTRTAARRYLSAAQIMEIAAICAEYEIVTMLFGGMGFHTGPTRRLLGDDAIPAVGPGRLARKADPAGSRAPRAASWAVDDPVIAAGLAQHPRIAHRLARFGRLAPRFAALREPDSSAVISHVTALTASAPIPHADTTVRGDLLRRMVDELYTDRIIGDDTWWAATEFFTDRELMDICVLVGGLRMHYFVAAAASTDKE